MRICSKTLAIKIDKLLNTGEQAVNDLWLVRDDTMTSYHYAVDIEMEINGATVVVNILIRLYKHVSNFIGSLCWLIYNTQNMTLSVS